MAAAAPAPPLFPTCIRLLTFEAWRALLCCICLEQWPFFQIPQQIILLLLLLLLPQGSLRAYIPANSKTQEGPKVMERGEIGWAGGGAGPGGWQLSCCSVAHRTAVLL